MRSPAKAVAGSRVERGSNNKRKRKKVHHHDSSESEGGSDKEWNEHDDNDYIDFLKDFLCPGQTVEVNDDDDADPEYNIMEDEEEEHDSEEFRRDPAVKISKKEFNELIAELYDIQTNEINKQNAATTVPSAAPATPAAASAVSAATAAGTSTIETPTYESALVEENCNSSINKVDQEEQQQRNQQQQREQLHQQQQVQQQQNQQQSLNNPQIVPEEPLITEIIQGKIKYQLQQHIQLLAQTYVLTAACQEDKLRNLARDSKKMIIELQSFALNYGPNTIFRVKNISCAANLVNTWPANFTSKSPIKKKILEERYRNETIKIGGSGQTFTRDIVKTISESKVFMYAELLPLFPHLSSDFKINFTANEDALIAIGYREMKGKEYEGLPTWKKAKLIAEMLLPGRPEHQIYHRIKNAQKKINDINNNSKSEEFESQNHKAKFDGLKILSKYLKEEPPPSPLESWTLELLNLEPVEPINQPKLPTQWVAILKNLRLEIFFKDDPLLESKFTKKGRYSNKSSKSDDESLNESDDSPEITRSTKNKSIERNNNKLSNNNNRFCTDPRDSLVENKFCNMKIPYNNPPPPTNSLQIPIAEDVQRIPVLDKNGVPAAYVIVPRRYFPSISPAPPAPPAIIIEDDINHDNEIIYENPVDPPTTSSKRADPKVEKFSSEFEEKKKKSLGKKVTSKCKNGDKSPVEIVDLPKKRRNSYGKNDNNKNTEEVQTKIGSRSSKRVRKSATNGSLTEENSGKSKFTPANSAKNQGKSKFTPENLTENQGKSNEKQLHPAGNWGKLNEKLPDFRENGVEKLNSSSVKLQLRKSILNVLDFSGKLTGNALDFSGKSSENAFNFSVKSSENPFNLSGKSGENAMDFPGKLMENALDFSGKSSGNLMKLVQNPANETVLDLSQTPRKIPSQHTFSLPCLTENFPGSLIEFNSLHPSPLKLDSVPQVYEDPGRKIINKSIRTVESVSVQLKEIVPEFTEIIDRTPENPSNKHKQDAKKLPKSKRNSKKTVEEGANLRAETSKKEKIPKKPPKNSPAIVVDLNNSARTRIYIRKSREEMSAAIEKKLQEEEKEGKSSKAGRAPAKSKTKITPKGGKKLGPGEKKLIVSAVNLNVNDPEEDVINNKFNFKNIFLTVGSTVTKYQGSDPVDTGDSTKPSEKSGNPSQQTEKSGSSGGNKSSGGSGRTPRGGTKRDRQTAGDGGDDGNNNPDRNNKKQLSAAKSDGDHQEETEEEEEENKEQKIVAPKPSTSKAHQHHQHSGPPPVLKTAKSGQQENKNADSKNMSATAATKKRIKKRSPGTKKRAPKFKTAEIQKLLEEGESVVNVEAIETAFAEEFWAKCQHTVDPVLYNNLISVFSDFGDKFASEEEVFSKVEEMLKDYPDLLIDLATMIEPQLLQKNNLLKDNYVVQAYIRFMHLLECPQLRARALQKIRGLRDLEKVTEKDVQELVDLFFQGNPIMTDAVKAMFPHIFPPESNIRSEDFEEINFDDDLSQSEEAMSIEFVSFPEEASIPATASCPCDCHTDPKNLHFHTKARHCRKCCIKFQDGKVFMHSGRLMKQVNIEFTTREKAEEILSRKPCGHCFEPLKATSSTASPKRRAVERIPKKRAAAAAAAAARSHKVTPTTILTTSDGDSEAERKSATINHPQTFTNTVVPSTSKSRPVEISGDEVQISASAMISSANLNDNANFLAASGKKVEEDLEEGEIIDEDERMDEIPGPSSFAFASGGGSGGGGVGEIKTEKETVKSGGSQGKSSASQKKSQSVQESPKAKPWSYEEDKILLVTCQQESSTGAAFGKILHKKLIPHRTIEDLKDRFNFLLSVIAKSKENEAPKKKEKY